MNAIVIPAIIKHKKKLLPSIDRYFEIFYYGYDSTIDGYIKTVPFSTLHNFTTYNF